MPVLQACQMYVKSLPPSVVIASKNLDLSCARAEREARED